MSLTDRYEIKTSVFVKIEVAEYYQQGSGLLGPETLTFSDHSNNYTLLGDEYTALGNLMSISSTVSELRPSSNSVTITLSGIPNQSIKEVVRSKLKGSPVTVYRAWFDVNTAEFISDPAIANPLTRWKGFISHYSLNETWDAVARESTNTIQLECASLVDILASKRSGRQTNSASMKRFFPNDVSFDRVNKIMGENIDFGEAE